MRYAILILLIALTSCNIPDLPTILSVYEVDYALQEAAIMEFDRGHCQATHYFSTFEAEYGEPALTSDWSIAHFLSTFSIPTVGEPSWCAEYDYTRFTPYHNGVIQAMKDWR